MHGQVSKPKDFGAKGMQVLYKPVTVSALAVTVSAFGKADFGGALILLIANIGDGKTAAKRAAIVKQ
jgi:hypothetical protein